MKSNMYKIYSIVSSVIFAPYTPFFKIIEAVVRNDDKTLNEEYRMNAHAAFNTIIKMMYNDQDKPFAVKRSDCVVNTTRQSIMSNIFGCECGSRKTTDKIISVSHKLFNTVLATMPWQVADLNQVNANVRITKLQQLIMKRLVSAGIDVIEDEGKMTHYAFIVSTPSQQKNGGMYMGKAEVMTLPVVQKALNFGRLFGEFNREVPSNATEWLKANALSATPADPTEYNLRDVIVMKAVKVKRLFKRVARVNNDGSITHLTEAELEQELFDGQMLWLKKVPSGQLRGWCFKAFGIRGDLLIETVKGWEDMVVIDVDGNERRLGDAVAICTDSCWKGSKFFKTYEEYVRTAEELAQFIPDFDKIWIVREAGEADEDGEKVDFGRRLSRQATQQWVNATLAQLSNLTRGTRIGLNALKTYGGLLKSASESGKKIQDRSDFAGLIEALPSLITTDPVQGWAEARYYRKQLDAAANRLHVNGNYPYICMDPWAMIQILILGRDPMSNDLGFLKAGEVYNRKYKNDQKLFAIRYPANYQTGTVLVNKIVDAFYSLGDVAVLPLYGDTIIREDGDFDGDEMMFCPDDIVIRLTENMIREFNPELIDFPHGKKAKMDVWGNRDERYAQIAETLWRSMKFNLVGVYSNMSVRCMHLHKTEECIMMHVMAILCLDMVKGTEVSAGILNKAEEIRKQIQKICDGAMPWNQIFRDKLKGIEGRKYMEASNDTVDTISKMILSTGEYTFDAQGHELGDDWRLMQSGDRSQSTRKGVLPESLAAEFCEFYSRTDMKEADMAICQKLRSGEKIGVAELMEAACVNELAMQYTCPGEALEDKKAAYRELIREMAIKLGRGQGLDDETLKAHVINWAASAAVTGKGVREDIRSNYALFVLRVFAKDFLHNVEANRGITGSDTFDARRQIAVEAETIDMDADLVSMDDLDF